MKKLIIISYYELKDYFICIKNCFEKLNYKVDSYPLFQYAYDSNDKLDDYQEHFKQFLAKSEFDILLWWFTDVPLDVFKYIRKCFPRQLFIIFNSDDPICVNTQTFEKCKNFDIIVTPNKGYLNKYKICSGVREVVYAPFAYDPAYFYPITDPDEYTEDDLEKYSCDISLYTINLYNNQYLNFNQHVELTTLIEDIIEYCKTNNRIFKLFGPPHFKAIFPDNYITDLEYINRNKLYNLSKINICTNPMIDRDGAVSEYLFSIMAAGGVVLTDPLKNLDKMIGKSSVFTINKDNYIPQIHKILSNYNDFRIYTLKKTVTEIAKPYDWAHWTERIHISICKKLFDKGLYAQIYNLDPTQDLWKYWLSQGIQKKQLCYNFEVPNKFNADDYAEVNSLKGRSNHYLYYHWSMNSGDTVYMSGGAKNNSFDPTDYNTSMEEIYKVFYIFNQIIDNPSNGENLMELQTVCKNNPRIKINQILENYLSSCNYFL